MGIVDKDTAVVKGLIILNHHREKTGDNIGAEHDTIFLYATDYPLGVKDVARMRELGFLQETEEYDPQEGWYIHV